MNDAEVVARVLDGDVDAYAVLVARYRPRLSRYALRMLGDREDAQEALQDAFVRAYRALARCGEPDRFGSWLFSILVNRCRTTGARSTRRARTFVSDEAAERWRSTNTRPSRPRGGRRSSGRWPNSIRSSGKLFC
jgi:RNA polymerase sigma-70 factor (ECF subfamily)